MENLGRNAEMLQSVSDDLTCCDILVKNKYAPPFVSGYDTQRHLDPLGTCVG